LERAIANASVDDLVQKHNELYSEAEKQIFNILKGWERFLGRNEFGEDDELMIKFTKPKVLVSDAETLANIEKRMALGLLTKAEALMMLNPNLSEDEAEEKLQEIENEKAENVRRFLTNGLSQANEGNDSGLESDTRQ
jgi:hypothetical protein